MRSAQAKSRSEKPSRVSDGKLKQAEHARLAALNLMEDAVRTQESLRESRKQLAAELEATRQLQAVSTELIREGKFDEIYERILDAAVTIMRSEFASMQRFHPERGEGELRLLSYRGFNPEAAKFWEWARPDSASTCGMALKTRQRCIVPDVEKSDFMTGTPDLETYLQTGIQSVQSTPLISRAGELLGMISTHWSEPHEPSQRDLNLFDVLARQAADIIERKRTQEEREQLLASEHEAREQAETANRVKDEFLATVSHELRTPLNAILGWAHMLMRGTLDEDATMRGLETIARNATSQNELISDLLDVSRIISGQLRCEMGAVELIPVIDAAAENVRLATDAKAIELRLILDPAAGMISGDAARLQQIVSNLLTNAIKFTPRDGRVEVRLQRQGTSVVIIVSDTGEGISAEFLPHIFDRFRQAEGTTMRKHGGLGLGLAIVRHLVELHGGTISAESHGVGKGAIFTASFPLIAVTRDTTLGALTASSGQTALRTQPAKSLGGLRVLVVDDSEDARYLLTIALTDGGAEVRASSSAREALDELDEWKPDVLVSDIGMPGEDGYELIRKVRALDPKRGGDVPAIALTGYASEGDATRARAAGYQLHLPKPVSPSELVAKLISLLDAAEKHPRSSD